MYETEWEDMQMKKFDSKSVMKSSYCEWNIDIDETIILCSEKDTLWLCVLY